MPLDIKTERKSFFFPNKTDDSVWIPSLLLYPTVNLIVESCAKLSDHYRFLESTNLMKGALFASVGFNSDITEQL